MPWILLLEEPVGGGELFVDAYNHQTPLEIKKLENFIDPNTGKMYDPPAILPADKKTEDWKPDEIGKMLFMLPDGLRYYKFIILESPIVNKEIDYFVHMKKETKGL
jgi:hypothetical protein